MDEFTKKDRRFVRVKGQEFPYDLKVTIYVDTETGNWVVRTPMGTEHTADLCAEVLDHFNEMLDHPGITLPDDEVLVLPMPTQDYH